MYHNKYRNGLIQTSTIKFLPDIILCIIYNFAYKSLKIQITSDNFNKKFVNYIYSTIFIFNNIIDFNNELTTITPTQSSYEEWTKYGGNMDKVLSYALYEGLGLYE